MAALLKTLGSVVVATGGTRVPLSDTGIHCYGICVQAPASNTGDLYFGDVTVTAANGHVIAPGGTFVLDLVPAKSLEGFMLNDYYLDAEVDGEGARVSYFVMRQS